MTLVRLQKKYKYGVKQPMKTKLLRICFIVTGILAFAIFTIPILFSVGLNLGNLTGILVSLALVMYGLFFQQINNIRKKWKQERLKKYFVYFAEGIVVLVASLTIILTVLMVRGATRAPEGKETLIVLGCRVYGERASLSLVERLEAACEYLAENPKSYCVVSGGQGTGEDISEAECMYRYLTDRGIAAERIFKEEASTSTRENLAFSLEVIEENDLPAEIAIATSEYHQYRVSLIAKKAGITNTAVSGKTAWWLFPTFYVRELYAILYEWLT